MGWQYDGGPHGRAGECAKKLIRAAILAARGKGPPPPLLQLAWFCGDHRLPDVGGVLDQDYSTMLRMGTLRNIYQVRQAAPRYTGKKIHDMPTDMKRLVKSLRDQGLWNG